MACAVPRRKGSNRRSRVSLFTACPICKTQTGDMHAEDCDIEQCMTCGGYRALCYCDNDDAARLAFDGDLPGAQAARRFGWFIRYAEFGFEQCAAEDEGATEDIQRVQFEAWWVSERKDWAKPVRS